MAVSSPRPFQEAVDSNAADLIATYGSPLYVYHLGLVRRRAAELRAALAKYADTHLMYAMKANSCPAVVRVLLSEGYGVDVVSPGEMHMALKLGVPPHKILFTENNMTDHEMRDALAAGVLINCGSVDRLERVAKAGGVEACVRFNPDVSAGAHEKICTAGPMTKFGVWHTLAGQIRRIEEETGIKVVGCHMHIGSGILEAPVYAQAMGVILGVAKQLPNLRFIDFGGGLGIPYKPTDVPIDLAAVGESAVALMTRFNAEYGRPISLHLEPGRFLVGECGTLYTTVTSIKTNPDGGRTFVGCDSGFNHMVRPCMYNAYHAIDNISNPKGEPKKVDVVGNICESGDIFARDRELPETRLNDILAIRFVGAYGMSMASTYNLRPLPAEVVVEAANASDARLARKKQSIVDLISQWEL